MKIVKIKAKELTPEEASKRTKKGWETRKRGGSRDNFPLGNHVKSAKNALKLAADNLGPDQLKSATKVLKSLKPSDGVPTETIAKYLQSMRGFLTKYSPHAKVAAGIVALAIGTMLVREILKNSKNQDLIEFKPKLIEHNTPKLLAEDSSNNVEEIGKQLRIGKRLFKAFGETLPEDILALKKRIGNKNFFLLMYYMVKQGLRTVGVKKDLLHTQIKDVSKLMQRGESNA